MWGPAGRLTLVRMSRHKGARKDWQDREDFPHAVEIAIPSALGPVKPRPMDMWSRRYSNMEQWCQIRVGISGYCTTSPRRPGGHWDAVEFRFREAAVAEEFRAVYGD